MQPEARISRAIIKALNDLPRCFAYKVHGGPMQVAGLPDVACIKDGRFIGLEVKTEENRNRTTVRQRWVGKMMKDAGAEWHVVCSVEEALQVVLGATS